MAKKKIKTKSIFKTKLTRTQIIFSLLFIIILFSGLGLFFLSTNTGLQYRMLVYSRLLQTKNNYNDSLTPIPKPKPSLTPGQRAVYTFYIRATSHKITTPKGLGINASDSGKTFTVDIGTFVDVDFGRNGNFKVTVTSPQNIFQCSGSCIPHSSPVYSIYSDGITHSGFATIQVVETANPQVIPTSTFVATTNTTCNSVDYTQSQAAAFITAYNNKSYGVLQLIVVCGTPSQGGYATQFTLVNDNKVFYGRQISYHDAQQPGPSSAYGCKLFINGSHSAVVTCGESSFNLSY